MRTGVCSLLWTHRLHTDATTAQHLSLMGQRSRASLEQNPRNTLAEGAFWPTDLGACPVHQLWAQELSREEHLSEAEPHIFGGALYS